jgi:multidrug efflux pump subunit AcrA (membrane-fusion protein)
MKRRRPRWWIGVVAIVCAALMLWMVIASSRESTAQVTSGSLSDRIVARAVVVAEGGVAEVRPRTDGRVLKVYVREGDAVEEGQILAEIEGDDLQAELARREAERQAAAATARSLAEGASAEERKALEAEVRAARHDFELAEERNKRLVKLREIGGGTEAETQEAGHAMEIARARLDAAEARLKLAKSGGKSTDVRALEARVTAAEAAIKEAQTGLARTKLVAPVAGVVLSRRVDAGDTITAASAANALPVFEIADISKTEVRVEVEEADATRLTPGAPVVLTMPGGRERVADGKISRIGARLERRTIGAEDARVRADGQVRAVWVEGAPTDLPIGQRLEAVIELSPRQVQAMVPRGALRVRDGRAVVEVPWGPWTKNVPVTLGAADEKHVELFGVEVGTKVVVSK